MSKKNENINEEVKNAEETAEDIKDIETKKTIEQAINKEKLVYDLYNNKYKVASFPLEYGSYLNYKKESKGK